MSLPEFIHDIRSYLVKLGAPESIDAAIILGSGLGGFGSEIENPFSISYSEIPGMPQSTVEGHTGSLIFGKIHGKTVLAFSGRFHYYEGYGFDKTIVPVQIAHAFQAEKLIISNAAGGINLDFRVGDLMIIDNIIRQSKMLSPPDPKRWVYDQYELTNKASELAQESGIEVKRGTYLFVTGPNYETKAEIHAFRYLGGDAVGMSTAPELMEASRLGLNTVAISLITNAAAGVTDQKLDHAEVKEAAEFKKDEFASLVKTLIKNL